MKKRLVHIMKTIPEGYSEGRHNHSKYGMTKTTFNNGKSFKLFAKELKGNKFISLNYYIPSTIECLKPCEMTQEKVVEFLINVEIILPS